MAKIQLGNLVTDARNHLGPITPLTTPPTAYQGGVVFSRNRDGNYAKHYVEPLYHLTDPDSATRDAMLAVGLRYDTILTDPMRQSWQRFAEEFATRRSITGRLPLSPRQAHAQVNLNSYRCAGTFIDTAPGDQKVNQPENLVLTSNDASQNAADGFDRADAEDLGTKWGLGANSKFQVYSHALAPDKAGADSLAQWLYLTFNPNMVVKCYVTAPPVGPHFLGLTARVTPTSWNLYVVVIRNDGLNLYRRQTGAFTLIGQDTREPQAGDVISLQCVGDQITVLLGTEIRIGPITDAVVTGPSAGIYGYDVATTTLLDRWQAFNYGAPLPLSLTLATAGSAGEYLVVRATPPLSAGVLSCHAWMKSLGAWPCPVTYPLDFFWTWKERYDQVTAKYPTPRGTLITGKRIGIEALFINAANGAASTSLSANTLTT